MNIRQLEAGDLARMAEMQREAYLPQLAEPAETFANKMALSPESSLGCVDGAELRGYALALPWRGEEVVPLNALLSALPTNPDTLYIHDLVVSKESRGLGIARMLLAALLGLAERRGLERLALVAVQGAEPFWRHLGFEDVESFEYTPGEPATRMVRARRPPPRTPTEPPRARPLGLGGIHRKH